jgi:hypothetical protein
MVGGILVTIATVATGIKLTDVLRRRRRRAFVKKFEGGIGYELSKKETALLERYKERGEKFLVAVCLLLRDSEALAKAVSNSVGMSKVERELEPMEVEFERVFIGEYLPGVSQKHVAQFLVETGIVTVEQEKPVIDQQAFDFINRFESFLLALVPKHVRPTRQTFGSEASPMAEAGQPTSPSNPPTRDE